MYKIPIPKPDANDFTFKLKKLEFHADVFLFSCFSELFQKNISLIEKKEYTVISDVSQESFQNFLDACQGKAFFLKPTNAYDMKLLCEEFQTNLFSDKVEQYLDTNKDEALIEKLKYYLCDEKKTNKDDENHPEKDEKVLKEITQEISERLVNMTDKSIDELISMNLTNEILNSFISAQNKNLNSKIVEKILEGDDELKFDIDLRALTMDQVQKLSKSKKLPEYYQSKNIFPYLNELINKINGQEKKINDLEESYKNFMNDLNNSIYDTRNDVRKISEGVNEILTEYNKINDEIKTFENKANEMDSNYEDLKEKINKFDSEHFFPLENKFNKLEEKIKRTVIINNPLKGIFHNLYIINNVNPAETDFLSINTPSNKNTDFKTSNLLEYDDDKIDDCYYHKISSPSEDKADSSNKSQKENINWIEFDFKDYYNVSLIAYTIRTNSFGETFSHPKDFMIQGSNGGKSWEIIDERKNAIELNGARKMHTYFLQELSKPYKKIRFLQLDTHFQYNDKQYVMALSAIELHGKTEYIHSVPKDK